MKAPQSLVVLALAAGLFLASSVSTAQAQAPKTPKRAPSGAPPSVVGGKPETLSVYNYTGEKVTPYWIDPSGEIQPVPDGKPIPPIAGKKPYPFPTFVGATLVFRKPAGGGVWRHMAGKNPEPLVIIGTPDKDTSVPDIVAKRLAARSKRRNSNANTKDDPSGELEESAFTRSPKAAPLIVNNSATPDRGRRRGRNAPDINVKITTPAPTDTDAAPTTPSSSKKPAGADASDRKGKRPLKADSPAIIEFLRIHNAARADVGASPLEWSDDLARTAQRWADRIARTGKFEHRRKSEYGENMARGEGDFTPAKAANGWLSEKADFSIDQEPKYRVTEVFQTEDGETVQRERDGETAHYTQMIWGKSTMVGVGVAKTESGTIVVVANYNPRGNIKGEKPY